MSRIPSFPHALLLSKLLYLGLVALTLAVAAVGHPYPGRGFSVEFGVGLGFVGFVMLAGQFALTTKFRWLSQMVGLDSLLHFHRQIGFFAYAFILLHVGFLVLAEPGYAAFPDPRVDLARPGPLERSPGPHRPPGLHPLAGGVGHLLGEIA